MMRAFVVAVLVLALAGCADEASTTPADHMEEIQVGDLHGVVVDEAIRPVAQARVVVSPSGKETATDENGSFAFRDMEPGTYTLTATAAGHLNATVIGHVLADERSPVVKIVLPLDTESTPYVTPYTFNGFFECGVWPESCTNVNIITWIILGIGNVTNDRSVFLQWIDGRPDYLQTELVWDSTQPLGDNLGFGIGGATVEQLSTGMADTYNYTHGESPLMLTVPPGQLEGSGIGVDRALLTQVLAGSAVESPVCVIYDPCGPGVQLMQEFQTFTHAFYRFAPEPDWQFSVDGPPTPP